MNVASGGDLLDTDIGAEVGKLETQFDVIRFMRRIGRNSDLPFFMVTSVPPRDATRLAGHSIVNNWPADALARYDELALLRRSAAIQKLRDVAVPFEATLEDWVGGAAELAGALEKAGLARSHFFPVHDAGGRRGAVIWSGRDRQQCCTHALYLQMVSIHVFNKLSDIGSAWNGTQVALTEREIQCLSWTAAGKTSLEIAEILGLSEHTVNHYLNQVSRKLDAVNRTQAVVNAMRRGLIA